MAAFNGARIDTKVSLSDESIGLGGGWVKTGNLLGAGGGDKLGSKDGFGWQMIVGNITYAGFEDDGSFYLSQGSTNPDRRYRQLMRNFNTVDDTPLNIHSITIGNLRAFTFSFSLIYLSDDGNHWGSIKREVTVFRDGGVLNKTKETTKHTERIGSKVIAQYVVSGTTLSIEFKGLVATDIKGSCYINFHGIQNP
jgi:hypothetical protein